ncbi:MAG: hypothetical protein ACYSUV_00085 [Planctomycetota bacterium]
MEFIDGMFEGAPAPTITPTKPATQPGTPPAPSKPRPGTKPWKPTRRPGVSPKPKAREDEDDFDTNRYMEPRPKACITKEAMGEVSVPPPPPDETEGPEPASLEGVCDIIKPGDRVTIATPHGNRLTGRATMRNRQQDCWVLNMGGRHGTPGIATEENVMKVKRGGQTVYSKM